MRWTTDWVKNVSYVYATESVFKGDPFIVGINVIIYVFMWSSMVTAYPFLFRYICIMALSIEIVDCVDYGVRTISERAFRQTKAFVHATLVEQFQSLFCKCVLPFHNKQATKDLCDIHMGKVCICQNLLQALGCIQRKYLNIPCSVVTIYSY